jgi:hypothetical protein
MTVIPATWEAEARGSQYKAGPGKSTRPYFFEKQTKAKRTQGAAQVAEGLLGKCEALSSIPSTTERGGEN